MVRAPPARSTTVKKILDYSTINGKLNRNFQRRRPPRRSARKLLSLCHTHESARRSLNLPCQIMVQRESSELEQNYGISYRKNGGRGGSSCRFDHEIGIIIFLWAMQHRCTYTCRPPFGGVGCSGGYRQQKAINSVAAYLPRGMPSRGACGLVTPLWVIVPGSTRRFYIITYGVLTISQV